MKNTSFLSLAWALLLLGIASVQAETQDENTATNGEDGEAHHDEEEVEPGYAVLFPWFVQVVGVFVFFILTRTFHGLPYTALMFLIGTIMGIGATESGITDQLTVSSLQWATINGEVLLLVFLPGLLFRDAFTVNFHLFTKAFGQLFIMAFIMVLAGTFLTGLVAKEVLPYEWSWSLSLTFGSILSATDPVAVAALLNEVGAPPRLKMHVSGESMLNDGSAMVFYTIFSALYLDELGLPGGEDIDTAKGFAIFFRMAGGGAAVGIAFGLGLLLMLTALDRRLDHEENVVQVAATVTVAYLSFYAAEMASEMSGVIAVVFCGITTRAFGAGLINNPEIMESFWVLLEHLLNTVLFALGGVVWGSVMTRTYEGENLWTGTDWGYLVLLYVLVVAIRGLLVAFFYPILSRMGLKTNPHESIFIWWGGLRGAVGIALAISLDEKIWSNTVEDNPDNFKARLDLTQLFGMVGGIAFFTLVINGTSAGPVLHKLGLAKSTVIRQRVVKCFERGLRKHVIDMFVDRMTHPLFCHVDFALVKHHVPSVGDLTIQELKSAVKRRKDEMNPKHYTAPHLESVIPYLIDPEASDDSNQAAFSALLADDETIILDDVTSLFSGSTAESPPQAIDKGPAIEEEDKQDLKTAGSSAATQQEVIELRMVFIELVRSTYAEYVNNGAMDARQFDGILVFSLFESLDQSADDASKGRSLNDWRHSQIEFNRWIYEGKRRVSVGKGKVQQSVCCGPELIDYLSIGKAQAALEISRGLAFIFAHREAQNKFRSYFAERRVAVPPAEKLVLEESAAQVEEAENLLKSFDEKIVKSVLSHALCLELLNGGAKYIEMLLESGLLKEREGRAYLMSMDNSIHQVSLCDLDKHPSGLSEKDKAEIIKKLKSSLGKDSSVKKADDEGEHPWLRDSMMRRRSVAPSHFIEC